jgi:choline dehydrogenase-like flavoprotein
MDGGSMSTEPTAAALASRIEEVGADLLARDAFELSLNASAGELDVVGDEWTLHFEGLPTQPLAWLAVDDEPDDPAEFPAVIHAYLDDETLAMLGAVDHSLGQVISAAMKASRDPLSLALADRLQTMDE